jgi:hypothetical protein
MGEMSESGFAGLSEFNRINPDKSEVSLFFILKIL